MEQPQQGFSVSMPKAGTVTDKLYVIGILKRNGNIRHSISYYTEYCTTNVQVQRERILQWFAARCHTGKGIYSGFWVGVGFSLKFKRHEEIPQGKMFNPNL